MPASCSSKIRPHNEHFEHTEQSTASALIKAIPRIAPGTRDHVSHSDLAYACELGFREAHMHSGLFPKRTERRSTNISFVVCISHGYPSCMPSKSMALRIVTEGVLVAKKDFNLPKHNEIDTKNLFVRNSCVERQPTRLPGTGHQSLPVLNLSRLPQDSVFLAMVLLHSHP